MTDIAGDCRYWPMGAWLQFVGGYPELLKYPALTFEYVCLLDFHGLGVTALQALGTLSPIPAQPDVSSGGQPAAASQPSPDSAATDTVETAASTGSVQPSGAPLEDGLSEEVRSLLLMWHRYWAEAMRTWEYLFTCFRTQQDMTPVKQQISQAGVHNNVGYQMGWLRGALQACLVAQRQSDPSAARPLFAALLELIGAGVFGLPTAAANLLAEKTSAGQGLEEIAKGQVIPSWEAVCNLINNDTPNTIGTIPAEATSAVTSTAESVDPPIAAALAQPQDLATALSHPRTDTSPPRLEPVFRSASPPRIKAHEKAAPRGPSDSPEAAGKHVRFVAT